MSKLYIDNNILRYLVNGFPAGFNAELENQALDRLIADEQIDFCFSLWNFAELAGSPLEEGDRYADLVERLNPIWMSERRYIQKSEIKDFINSEILGIDVVPAQSAYNTAFSQMMTTIEGMEGEAMVGETPRRFIRYLCSHGDSAEAIRIRANEHPAILEVLQVARQDRARWHEVELLGFRQTLTGLLPMLDAQGRQVAADQRRAWLEECVRRREALRHACPSIAIEDYLTDFRTNNPQRRPMPSDALDYQHAVTATPYTDRLITADGYLTQTAVYCARRLRRDFRVCRTFSEIH